MTTVVSVLVVNVGREGVLAKGAWALSRLLKEFGEPEGMTSSDLREGFGVAMVAESRRSAVGLVMGGGMLMLALAVEVVSVLACGLRRRSPALLAASKECVESVRCVIARGVGVATLELLAEDSLRAGVRPGLSGRTTFSEPFVGVLARWRSIGKNEGNN